MYVLNEIKSLMYMEFGQAKVNVVLAWHHRNSREMTITLFAPLVRKGLYPSLFLVVITFTKGLVNLFHQRFHPCRALFVGNLKKLSVKSKFHAKGETI